jgi:hypothetical protein
MQARRTRSPVIWRRLLAASTLLLVTAASAAAQEARGRVVELGTVQPVVGAVVLLLGARGDTVARTLTGPTGDFVLRAADGAGRRVRVIRIGYQPREVPAAGGGAPTDVELERLPTLLSEVRVRGAASCPARPDRQLAFGLWEQARAAFLAAVVARTERPGAKMLLRFEQRLAADGHPFTNAVRAYVEMGGNDAFVAARSARDFRRYGFVERSGGSRQYFGPDAELLLDPDFVRSYCLALAPSPDPTIVGVSFSPALRGRLPVDVRGEIRVDTVRRTVTEVTFRYLGLPGVAEREGAGGSVAYATFDNGVILAQRWEFHLVETTPIRATARHDPAAPSVLAGIGRIGGELARVRWDDGTEWRAPLGRLTGRILTCGRTPATGFTVRLDDTDYVGVADSLGRFAVDDLLPGVYEAVVEDPQEREERFRERSRFRFETARDSTLDVVLLVSDGRTRCGDAPSVASRRRP